MPVSRKRKNRKKNSAPKKSRRPLAYEMGGAYPGLEYRQRLDARRAEIAAEVAEPFIADLIAVAPTLTADELEDDLCRRLGAQLTRLEELPPLESVSPEVFGEAVLTAAADAMQAALDTSAEWQQPWRVLTAVAGIIPEPLSEDAAELIAAFAEPATGRHTPANREVTAPVQWTRDAYGSRFALTAPFRSAEGQDRWYLWDVDACGYQAFTVYSAFYPSAEAALAAWRSGVGEVAASTAALTIVDDPVLAVDLLHRETGLLRLGGENEHQFAEYHRSRRLAEAAVRAVGPLQPKPPALNAKDATKQFTAWVRAKRTAPAELEELVAEVADTWSPAGVADLYTTCSPHRVAQTVLQLRDYYQPESAEELVSLLPEWITWLAELNNTPPELSDRCRPYALGEPHSGFAPNDTMPRVLE